MESVNRPHVIVIASPGLGHLIPLLELGKRFVDHHDVQVTLFIVEVESGHVQSKLQELLCNKNDLLHVEVIQPETKLSPEADFITRIVVTMQEAKPVVRKRIAEMEIRPMGLIVDLFGIEYYRVADEFEMPKYVFMTANAWTLALLVYAHVMEEVSIDETVSHGLVHIPGSAPIRTADLFEGTHPSGPAAQSGAKLATADAILVNTWEALEQDTLKSFRDPNLLGSIVKCPVYPIGPVVREADMSKLDAELLHWLSNQPYDSVLFISFGSGGALSYEQVQELALGLEASKQRFLWVLRPPTDKTASEYFFNTEKKDQDNPASWLPDGFLTRTSQLGRVVPIWAPQTEILSHPSIGGFLTHCGWNSTLESIVNGVPMITWPLYAEQKMNATMLSRQLKIAVAPSKWPEEGIIGRDEIKKMVETVMLYTEGESSLRDRVKEFKLNAAKALDKTENGSSYNSLCEFVQVLKDKM